MLMAVKFERTAHWRCRVRSLRARQAHLLTKEEKAVGAVLDDLKHSHPRGAASGLGVDVADASVSEALDHSNVGVHGKQADVVAINIPVGDRRAVGGNEAV
jgi:hypothetical protein